MTESALYPTIAGLWAALAVVVFVALFFVDAPYGRFTRAGFGPRLNNRLGWMLQELPAAILFFLFYLAGDRRRELVPILLLLHYEVHYLHRALIFPFRLRGERRQTTWFVVALAIVFNAANTYFIARPIFTLEPGLPPDWFSDPRFLLGTLLFWLGFAVNKHSDHLLIHLRTAGEAGYRIPRGGLFELVSSPNYLGEMIQWGGFALMCWNLGALSFLVWTVANLAPRAVAVHRWYRTEFPDYPSERKALLPFIA